MVLAYIAHITFSANDRREAFSIKQVNSVVAESSWKEQTDRCTITLPRNVNAFDKNKVNHFFRRGDQVTVNLGYNGVLHEIFRGYITEVGADVPIVIKCEDEMWKLKLKAAYVSLKNAKLEQLIRSIAPGYALDVLDVNIGTVRFSQTTVAEVLKVLKDDFGLYSYFQNRKLVVGKIYDDNTSTYDIHLERDLSGNNLQFINEADKQIELTAVSTLFNGNKVEVKLGDEGGEPRQLSYFNIENQSELKKLAENDLARIKQSGYEGDISAFANIGDNIIHGDKANLISSIYPERNGLYYVDKVEHRLVDSPEYKKIITLGQKV